MSGSQILNGVRASDPISPADLAGYQQDGYVLVKGLISYQEAALIRDAFMQENQHGPVPGLSDIRPGSQAAKGDEPAGPSDPLLFYPRMMHPHRHPDKAVGGVAKKYMLDKRIERVLSALLEEQPYAVQSMFYFKPPGARGQDLHQDNFYLRVKPGTCMAAWIALDDCDAQNGGMACVPTTARLATQCPTLADPATSFTTEHVEPPVGLKPELVNMRPGDVLFFNGQVIHGSGPNASKDRFRRSLIFHYIPKSTLELSHFYSAYDFAGNSIAVRVNQDGGPCGTPHEAAGPH